MIPANWPNRCAVCYQASGNLINCKRCKMVKYCSARHKRDNFRHHVPYCKILEKGIDKPPEDCSDITPYVFFSITVYPNRCIVCGKLENVYFCKNCNSVGFCSMSHEMRYMRKHLMTCELLKISFTAEKFYHLYEPLEYKFLKENMKKEIEDYRNTIDLINLFKVCYNRRNGSSVLADFTQDELRMCGSLWTTTNISLLVTIAIALEHVPYNNVLNIHIVRNPTSAPYDVFRDILRLFLKSRVPILNICVSDSHGLTTEVQHRNCFVEYIDSPYPYFNTSLQRPELIVYNAHHVSLSQDVFAHLTSFLHHNNVYILILSPSDGVLWAILNLFKKDGNLGDIFDIIKPPQLNKFRDYRPERNIYFSEMGEIIYNFHYYMIMVTRIPTPNEQKIE